MLRRLVYAGFTVMVFVQTLLVVLSGVMGKVFWFSPRLLLPLEFLVALPAAAGWSYMLAGEGAEWRRIRWCVWIGAAALFSTPTWAYLAGF